MFKESFTFSSARITTNTMHLITTLFPARAKEIMRRLDGSEPFIVEVRRYTASGDVSLWAWYDKYNMAKELSTARYNTPLN